MGTSVGVGSYGMKSVDTGVIYLQLDPVTNGFYLQRIHSNTQSSNIYTRSGAQFHIKEG